MIKTKLPVLLIVHNILTAAVFHHKSMYLGEQDKSQCVQWNHTSTVFFLNIVRVREVKCAEDLKKKKSYCGLKKLLCQAVFQFYFQEFAVQTMERRDWLLPASRDLLVQTKQPSVNVRAKEE